MSEQNEQHQTFQDEAKRETALLVAISRAIEASPIKHQGDRESAVRGILATLQSSHTLRVGDRGWVSALNRDGSPADFAKLVTDAMLLDKSLGDSASIAAAVKAGSISLGAKSELTTPAQKIEFINRFGLEAWEKLPTQRVGAVTPSKEMTKREYLAMSIKERIALQSTLTEQELGTILSRR
jgi:hypothetical protein